MIRARGSREDEGESLLELIRVVGDGDDVDTGKNVVGDGQKLDLRATVLSEGLETEKVSFRRRKFDSRECTHVDQGRAEEGHGVERSDYRHVVGSREPDLPRCESLGDVARRRGA